LKIPILYRKSILNFLKAYFIFSEDTYITSEIFIKNIIKAYNERQFELEKIFEIKNNLEIINEQEETNKNCPTVILESNYNREALEISKKKYSKSFISSTIKPTKRNIQMKNSNVFYEIVKQSFK